MLRVEIIIADSNKQVFVLGKFPLPVEVIRFAQALVSKKISALGATVQLRKDRAGEPFIADEGHQILDCYFGQIRDPPALAYTLSEIPGCGRAWIVYQSSGCGAVGERVGGAGITAQASV